VAPKGISRRGRPCIDDRRPWHARAPPKMEIAIHPESRVQMPGSHRSRSLVEGARSAGPPRSSGTFGSQGIQHLSGRDACGHALCILRVNRQGRLPIGRKLPGPGGVPVRHVLREQGLVRLEPGAPFSFLFPAALHCVAEMRQYILGNKEARFFRPAELSLAPFSSTSPGGSPCALLVSLAGGQAVADMGVANDQRGTRVFFG